MVVNYGRSALEILREEGPGKLSKVSTRFVQRKVASTLREPWDRRYIKLWSWATYGRHHNAPLKPFRVLWVNPHDIVYHQDHPKPAGGASHQKFSYVLEGDWDRNLPPFEEHPVYRFIRDRYERGMSAKDTNFFEHFRAELSEQESYWNGCKSIEDFHERCAYVDELYEEIHEHGIKSAEQRRSEGRYIGSSPDNVTINIGRDGELIYVNGRHRLSIAKILNIELPVNVMIRHADWQAVRDAVVRSDDLSEVDMDIKQHLNHPDVEYLQSYSDKRGNRLTVA